MLIPIGAGQRAVSKRVTLIMLRVHDDVHSIAVLVHDLFCICKKKKQIEQISKFFIVSHPEFNENILSQKCGISIWFFFPISLNNGIPKKKMFHLVYGFVYNQFLLIVLETGLFDSVFFSLLFMF